MRLPSPRIIAVDDEPKHLEGLAQGLNRYGAACLPVHFTGEVDIAPCPHVRVIFADLHLGGGPPGNHAQDFGMIGGLIEETIQPSGPYFIVLWTMYPNQASELNKFLTERLQNVANPIAVLALNKNDHLDPDGEVRNAEILVGGIAEIVAAQPQIGALFNWEERVLDAATDTMSSMTEMAAAGAQGSGLADEVGKLLKYLAEAAVGSNHVVEDPFRAVNEALLPILEDCMGAMHSREIDSKLWDSALSRTGTGSSLGPNEVARLNRLLHIAHTTDRSSWTERGSVIPLPNRFSGSKFKRWFGLDQNTAAEKSFRCRNFSTSSPQFRWVLVQSQAACDYAQMRPGPLPFNLGLCLPASNIDRSRKPPAALWASPCFEFDGHTVLHVNAGFQIPLPRTAQRIESPLFRLREQLLNDLIYQVHGHGARPGTIQFR